MPVDRICLLVLQLLEKQLESLERLLDLIFEPEFLISVNLQS